MSNPLVPPPKCIFSTMRMLGMQGKVGQWVNVAARNGIVAYGVLDSIVLDPGFITIKRTSITTSTENETPSLLIRIDAVDIEKVSFGSGMVYKGDYLSSPASYGKWMSRVRSIWKKH